MIPGTTRWEYGSLGVEYRGGRTCSNTKCRAPIQDSTKGNLCKACRNKAHFGDEVQGQVARLLAWRDYRDEMEG